MRSPQSPTNTYSSAHFPAARALKRAAKYRTFAYLVAGCALVAFLPLACLAEVRDEESATEECPAVAPDERQGPNGAPCCADTACASGACWRGQDGAAGREGGASGPEAGMCCSEPCSEPGESCLESETGLPDGLCRPRR